MLKRAAYTLLPVAYMGVLYYLSSIPASQLGRLGIFGRLGLRLSDKLIHGIAYAVLAFLLYLALSQGWRVSPALSGAWAWILSVVYGVTDEYHQSFVPGREPSFGDLVADAVGAAAALLAVALVTAIGRRGAWHRAGSRRQP